VIRHVSHAPALVLTLPVPPLALRPAAGATVEVLGRPVLPPGGDHAGWAHIGMQQVNFQRDHDVIRAAGRGRIRNIRIAVEGGGRATVHVSGRR
jgi:hypothetical protein